MNQVTIINIPIHSQVNDNKIDLAGLFKLLLSKKNTAIVTATIFIINQLNLHKKSKNTL